MGTVVPKLGYLRNGQRIIMRMTKSFNMNFFIVEIFIEAQNTSILSKVVPKVSDFWTPALWGRTGSWNDYPAKQLIYLFMKYIVVESETSLGAMLWGPFFFFFLIYQFSNLANSKDILSWTKVFVSLTGPMAKSKNFASLNFSSNGRKGKICTCWSEPLLYNRDFYWNE